MKSKYLIPAGHLLLAAGCGISGIGCLCTAFGLPMDLRLAVPLCLLFALAACTLRGMRLGLLVWPGALIVCGAAYMILDLHSGFLTIAAGACRQWSKVYEFEIPLFLLEQEAADPAAAIAFTAGCLSFLAGTALAKGRTLPALTAVALPVIPCMVIPTTVPGTGYLMASFICALLLALTAFVRRTDRPQGVRLLAMALIPAALFTGLIFRANPREDFEPFNTDSPMEFLEDLQERLCVPDLIQLDWWLGETPEPTQPEILEPATLDLTKLGPREQGDGVVMEVTTDYSGILYLRGRSYNHYDGTVWSNRMMSTLSAESSSCDGRPYTISIATPHNDPQYYLPYYIEDPALLDDGICPNETGEQSYAFTFQTMHHRWPQEWVYENPTADMPFIFDSTASVVHWRHQCESYPEDMLKDARALIGRMGIGSDTHVLQAVEIVSEYVRSHGAYDPEPVLMPAERGDFTLWFLQESESGYSTHYASAATVLLQLLNIRARLVTGYIVETQANVTIPVTEAMAHTWVEYYLDGVGWIVLEVTPGFAPEATPSGTWDDLVFPGEEPSQPVSDDSDNSDLPPGNGGHNLTDPGNPSYQESTDDSGNLPGGAAGPQTQQNPLGERHILTETTQFDLGSVGPTKPGSDPLMQILTDYSGVLYLRGASSGHYTGTQWLPIQGQDVLGVPMDYLNKQKYEVTVETLVPANTQYTACYEKSPGAVLIDGICAAEDIPTEYVLTFRDLHDQWQQTWLESHEGCTVGYMGATPSYQSKYIQLPDETRASARQILERLGITDDTPVTEATAAIRDYVQSSARYSLNTPRMPADCTDFVLWFLQESDTGYCMHFASAAAVLLRAANIPARFTTGFMVSTEADIPIEVTPENAHAWVEYHIPDIGWIIMEATASDSADPEVPEVTEPDSTVPAPSTDATEAPTVPGTEEEADPGFNVMPLLILLAVAGMIPLQWNARLLWRRHRLRRGTSNARALACWQEAQRIAKLLKEEPPQTLFELARKAKYSQYVITDEELGQFEAYFSRYVLQIQSLPIFRRILHRILFAAY